MFGFSNRSILAGQALLAGTVGIFCSGFASVAHADSDDWVAPRAGVSTIVLLVDNVRSSSGQVCYALFPEDGDLSDNSSAVRDGCGAISSTAGGRLKSEIRIPNVPYGQYALAVFHDQNGNGVLDTKRLFGFDIPKEDFGFSNNPRVDTSGPRFQDALFNVDQAYRGLGVLLQKPPL